MSATEAGEPDERLLEEINELKAYHAREMAAMNAAHANAVTDLKSRFTKKITLLQNEIARLERKFDGHLNGDFKPQGQPSGRSGGVRRSGMTRRRVGNSAD
jgi:hypothetical protein